MTAALIAQLIPLFATGISQFIVAIKTQGGGTATVTITLQNDQIAQEILDKWAKYDAAQAPKLP